MSKPVRTTAGARRAGFSLVELIIVIAITSIIAASLAVVLRPTIDAYVDTRARSDLSDQADTALRRMLRDVRQAVPNSIRMPNSQCFEMVPTITGGRFRKGVDTVNDGASTCNDTMGSAASCPVDTSKETVVFDSLTPLSTLPAANDWVVINNQNTSDVYLGSNRARVVTAAALSAGDKRGRARIQIEGRQFPSGYEGGRFMVIPNSQQAVFYVCAGADGNLDAGGNGKGTLFRVRGYGFNSDPPSACPSVTNADVVATHLSNCRFIYNPNQGVTQQSGFIWLEMTMVRSSETAHLSVGAHVLNTP